MFKKNIIKIIFIMIFAIFINTTVSNAAIYAQNKTVNAGENFSILITSNIPVVSYKVTMNGTGGLTFVSSSGGTGAGSYTITDAKTTGMTSLATYSFKAPNVTTDTTYKVSFTANAMEDENFNGIDDSSAMATITVKAPVTDNNSNNSGTSTKPSNQTNNKQTNNKPNTSTETKSSDASLKSLLIEGYELYPAFDSSIKEYNLKVTNDITTVTLISTVNNAKASYKIEGMPEELQVGKNEVSIIVTAEDGTTDTYKLTITKERETLKLQQLKIFYIDEEGNTRELVLNPELNEEIYEYTLEDISYLISKLDVEVLANLEEAKIEITGNEELVEGENIITITMTMSSESEEETDEVLIYKITVNKEKAPVVTLMGKITNWFKGITGTIGTWYGNNKYPIVMYSLIVCSMALGGLSVYLIMDYKKYKNLLEKVAEITRINSGNIDNIKVAENGNTEDIIDDEENEKSAEIVEPEGRHF